MAEKDTDIAALVAQVEQARTALESAERELSVARNKECDATNAFNAATKRLDEAVATLRTQAPRGTDWASREGRP
jgi:chromosome segregation ATPase